jgi:hypothetical protein
MHLGRMGGNVRALARESRERHVWLEAPVLLLRRGRSALVVASHGRPPTLRPLVVGLLLLAEPVLRHVSLLLVAKLVAKVKNGAQDSEDVCQIA